MAQPWDKLEGESELWYGRFEQYKLLGKKRSVEVVWREEVRKATGSEPEAKSYPGHWRDHQSAFRWVERAEAWDASERQRRAEEHEEQRQQQRDFRRSLLIIAQQKAAEALQRLDPAMLATPEVFKVLKDLASESRAEFDDEPRHRAEVTHRGDSKAPVVIKVLRDVSMEDI